MAEIPWQKLGIPPEHREKVVPEAPLKVRLAVAKGLLPLPPHQLVPMAYVLLGDKDPGVAEAARRTLTEIPVSTLLSGVITSSTLPKMLEFFAEVRRSEARLMEVIYRNRDANDRTAILIAESATGDLLDQVYRNQERLLITPKVYQALLRNPKSSKAELERVAAFLRMNDLIPDEEPAPAPAPAAAPAKPAGLSEEERRARQLEAEVEAALMGLPSPTTNPEVREELKMFDLDDFDPVEDVQAAGLGGFIFGFTDQDAFSFDLTNERDPDAGALDEMERLNITQQLNNMTIGQKIKLAYKGNAEVRKLLVRDRNKMVAGAVIKSGRMSDAELLSVAQNRNLDGEVIRELTRIKEAMRKYPIKVALANNPKTPVSLAVSLVNQLQKRDLQALARNKNVSGAVHQLAVRKVRATRVG